MNKTLKTILAFALVVAVAIFALYTKGGTEQDNPWTAEALWYKASQTYDEDRIDVLYFVSTEVLSATDSTGQVAWQSQLVPEDMVGINSELNWVESNMFCDDFNFYAPYYHQYTFDAVWQLDSVRFDSVYSRVVSEACEAFDSYMTHKNNGRPFILAGFSQGAMLTLDVLKHMTDQQYSQMIACYTMGYRLSAEDLGHPHIKAATGERDRGVVVSFNSVQTKDAIWSFVAKDAATCINPVNWRTDATPATFTFDGTTNEVRVDPESNVLIVTTDNPPYYHAFYDKATFFKDANVGRDNLHHWDLLFYSRMIHDNALRRAGVME